MKSIKGMRLFTILWAFDQLDVVPTRPHFVDINMLNDVVVIFLFEIASVVLNTLHLLLDLGGEYTRNQFRLGDLLNYNTTLI